MELELGDHHVLGRDHVFKVRKLGFLDNRELEVGGVQNVTATVSESLAGEDRKGPVEVQRLVEGHTIVGDGVQIRPLLLVVNKLDANVTALAVFEVGHGVGVHEAKVGRALDAEVTAATDDLTNLLQTFGGEGRDGPELVEVELRFVLGQALNAGTSLSRRSSKPEQSVGGASEGTRSKVTVQAQEPREGAGVERVVARGSSAAEEEGLQAPVGALHEGLRVLLDQTHDSEGAVVLSKFPVGDGDGSSQTMRLDLQLLSPLVAGEVEKLGTVVDAATRGRATRHDGALDGGTTVHVLANTVVLHEGVKERSTAHEGVNKRTLQLPVGRVQDLGRNGHDGLRKAEIQKK